MKTNRSYTINKIEDLWKYSHVLSKKPKRQFTQTEKNKLKRKRKEFRKG